MNIVTCKKGTFFMADTLINRHPSTEVLIDIARLTHDAVKFFAHDPVISMVSYSNFGSDKQGSPLKVHGAIEYLHKNHPEIVVDGEMQVNFALDKKLRDDMYPVQQAERQRCKHIGIPEPEFGQQCLQTVARNGCRRNHRPDPDGIEQTDSLHRRRKLYPRHPQPDNRRRCRCNRTGAN